LGGGIVGGETEPDGVFGGEDNSAPVPWEAATSFNANILGEATNKASLGGAEGRINYAVLEIGTASEVHCGWREDAPILTVTAYEHRSGTDGDASPITAVRVDVLHHGVLLLATGDVEDPLFRHCALFAIGALLDGSYVGPFLSSTRSASYVPPSGFGVRHLTDVVRGSGDR